MNNPTTVNRFSSREFTYSPEAKLFTAEASTLQWGRGDIVIVSARTGAECKFEFDGHEQRDNETVAFRFLGTGAAFGCRALIFND
jgi:hypothetical protein